MMFANGTALRKTVPGFAGAHGAAAQRNVQAHGVGDQVKKSVKPRVKQLRGKQTGKSKGVGDAMRPEGPGPELINGRLAMVGFLATVGAELYTNETLFQQVRDAPIAITGAAAAVIVASLVPLVRGTNVKDDGSGEGVKPGAFNFTNEIINGRAAMIGIALVIGYELVYNKALFQT